MASQLAQPVEFLQNHGVTPFRYWAPACRKPRLKFYFWNHNKVHIRTVKFVHSVVIRYFFHNPILLKLYNYVLYWYWNVIPWYVLLFPPLIFPFSCIPKDFRRNHLSRAKTINRHKTTSSNIFCQTCAWLSTQKFPYAGQNRLQAPKIGMIAIFEL